MKKSSIVAAELLDGIAFLLWLFGSALALIRHGIELSLWVITLAMLISFVVRVFPLLGIRWLRLEKMGCPFGQSLAIFLQVVSWGTFAYAMFLRLGRNMNLFFTLITLTTLLWASWLLIFIYSRHACHPKKSDDTLKRKT
ncbi:MAG: hypothetical protein SVT56_07710 [Chloroflexota bacterium]|jgi:hypothetical protein|nr:hypothetical protein [Chloroflexota bacterium]